MIFRKSLQKMTIMLTLIMVMGSSVVFAGGTRFSLKKGVFKSDKVWNIKFNAKIKKESLSKVNVYKDFYGKEPVEGTSIILDSKDKAKILVNPPEGGYDQGDYYVIIESGLESQSSKYDFLEDRIIYQFHVETNKLESVEEDRVLFEHYAVEDKLREESTWIKNNKDKEEYDIVESVNSENLKNLNAVVDIWNLDSIKKSRLIEMMGRYKRPNRTMYNKDGQTLTSQFYNEVERNRNIQNIKAEETVKFGVILTRSDVRGFPTGVEYHKIKNDRFDRIQETAFEAGEGVAILHESSDEKWLFVQGYNYYGWVLKENIAVGGKSEIKDFVMAEKFIVILEDRVKLKGDNEYLYSMGVRLPIEYIEKSEKDFMVSIPTRGTDGELLIQNAFVGDIDYSVGYLKLTRENIIKQALKLQGTKYSWGDKDTGRDCSSTMMSIYRTMGISLPRNTDEQEDSFGESLNLIGKDRSERYAEVNELETGDILFLRGHEVMYLGKIDGKDYIIHNFTGATIKSDNSSRYEDVFRVGITPIDMLSGSGSSYIDLYTSFLKILN